MDVNGTRFHLLLGQDDWDALIHSSGSSADPGLYWHEACASLSLCPLLFRFPTPPGDRLPRLQDRRGSDRDRYGNWYWIAEDETEIRFLPPGRRQSEHFWSTEDLAATCVHEEEAGAFRPVAGPPPQTSLRLRGLTVTEHHYLVVGVLEPAGLVIFDLHAGGPPIQIHWPSQIPFAPFDMAPAPGGGVWILDRDLNQATDLEARYWALDRYFRVTPTDQAEVEIEAPGDEDFRPESGPPRQWPGRSFPAGISLEMGSPVETLHPLAIEALPDGTALILDSDPDIAYSMVYRYRFGRQLGPAWSLERALETLLDAQPGPQNPNPYALRGHDMAFLPKQKVESDHVTGTLYIVASDGNQTFAFDFQEDEIGFSLKLLPKYFPMRLFSGKALAAADQAVHYDLQDRWLPLIERPRPRYKMEGTSETSVFDGKEPDCVWHRLFLDASIPPGTKVLIESRAANNPNLLTTMPWQEEPRLYCRSDESELPYYQPFSPDEARQDGSGVWELLFQRVRGRYLQLRITLQGTGRNTPRLRALRVYYPRFSYLKEYLPAVYQEDEISASFLERFLANIEGVYTTLEGKIEQVQTLFDVRTTTAEYLDWLAGWFGVALDPGWNERRRRLFLSHAFELFNQRGTLAGLIRAIRLATDPCPDDTLFEEDVFEARNSVRIVERFFTRSTPGVVYGDPTDVTLPGLAAPTSDWTPEHGAAPLHQRYRDYLKERYRDINTLNAAWGTDRNDFHEILMPPVRPFNSAEAEDWQRFLQAGLGFTYIAVSASDRKAYQNFLARRYRQVERLNRTYQLTGDRARASFEQVELPEEGDLPSGGKRLYDWTQFVSLVLPICRNAHQFSVLIPIELQSDITSRQRRVDLVQRIVELEKPVHTQFEVRGYWDVFRIGEARLGLDTALGEGSRFAAMVIGYHYLASSYLYPSHPMDVQERVISDRDYLGGLPPL